MKRRKITAALALLLAGLLALGGCAAPAEPLPQPGERPVAVVNDGSPARIVIGEVLESRARTDVLLEIAQKYMADYPATTLEVRTYATPEDLRAAAAAGEVQIVDVTDRELPEYVAAGALRELTEYLPGWEESVTLLPLAALAGAGTDATRTYLMASDAVQDLLIYRKDWYDGYNDGLEERDRVYARIWEQLLAAREKLGEKALLVFAGQDRLTDFFDELLWSGLTVGRMLDPCYSYYYPSDPVTTVFQHERALDGVDQFTRVMQGMTLPETWDYTLDQAVDAFVAGEAAFLVADRGVLPELAERMPQGTWAAKEFPIGVSGTAVLSPVSFRGWGITSSAEDWEKAFHFLTFLSNADNNTYYAKVCGTYPIHSSAPVLEPAFSGSDLKADIAMGKHPDWYVYAREPVMFRAREDYRQQAGDWLRQYLAGEISQEELLDRLDGFWMAALEQEGPRWEE